MAQPSGVADRVAVPVAKPGWPAGGWLSQACSDRKELGVAAPAYVVAAFGSPFLDSRRKYGLGE